MKKKNVQKKIDHICSIMEKLYMLPILLTVLWLVTVYCKLFKNTRSELACKCPFYYRQLANKCTEDEFVVGFDMEWPFNFQTGSGKTALIQISPSLDICYLLHLPQIEKLPKGLTEFLHHPKVKLTGVNIKK